jgi:hypothetical protein
MNRQQMNVFGIGTVIAVNAVGCGDGGARSHSTPWADQRTQVIDFDRSIAERDAPNGDECLDVDSADCIKPQQTCGGLAADVILDAEGKVLETVCYPEGDSLTVEEIESQDGSVEQNQNDAVIVLDGADDGVDLEGDLSVDANNVVVYGEGPDTSVISGNVEVDGNGIIVRGVRIQGDVTIIANNAVFLHCVIEGNVTITGNGALLAASDIFGDVSVTGNNDQLVGNRIVGELADGGKNTVCEENFGAEDSDESQTIEQTELGAALACAGRQP